MRLNKYIASRTSLSRRASDSAIQQGRVQVNGKKPELGYAVTENDEITLDGKILSKVKDKAETLILNKPAGYVCGRKGQGSQTIYDLLPEKYHKLNPIGRLDKDSSGLLVLTNDGELANRLAHPRYQKTKIYEIELDKSLAPFHQQMISDHGINLDDGKSKLLLEKLDSSKKFRVTMSEGRNRQIRRTFDALGYKVTKLHRTHFGEYTLKNTETGQIEPILNQ